MSNNNQTLISESLSALVDGEHNDIDLQRVLSALDDPSRADAVRASWLSYHSAKAAAQGEAHLAFGKIDLASSVRSSLESESAPRAPLSSRVWRGIGQTGVAAAVMIGLVAGAQYLGGPGGEDAGVAAPTVAESASGATVPRGFDLPPLTARTVSTARLGGNETTPSAMTVVPRARVVITSSEFQDHVDRLIFKHAEQASSSGAMGLIPLARVSEVSEMTLESASQAQESK